MHKCYGKNSLQKQQMQSEAHYSALHLICDTEFNLPAPPFIWYDISPIHQAIDVTDVICIYRELLPHDI